ncbi:24846_t:CDS:1 [Entrophospora sp. SA101]|nr:1687_t:CDS:1 [Entrophospora sp. SA101]CAJ0641053.1 53_t:CDS:1 [Entrophospora sp. SA101]CAJ0745056.1 13776_t:CDS:1 [Entrophospora sp. SA101]CAJ0751048.1 11239_t:CDS:1 [Entrophospora sp. SA101]CAJ0755701.1 321_t:CDS:1 [Entrophospora sp. SA101]
MPKKNKSFKISDVLNKWLESRIKSRLEKNAGGFLTAEQALDDIIKEITIKSLSQLPLPVFSISMKTLAELDEKSKLEMLEGLIAITPNPEFAFAVTTSSTSSFSNVGNGGVVVADKIRDYLVSILLPTTTTTSSSSQENSTKVSIEIQPRFLNIVNTVLKESYDS